MSGGISNLSELADRVEGAAGPDREVDRLIYRDVAGKCLHPTDRLERTGAQSDTGFDCLDCGADSWGNKGRSGEGLHDKIPAYTSSLDAAMALVPEGCGLALRQPIRFLPSAVVYDNEFGGPSFDGRAKSLPLALTAACLRALSEERGNG